MQWWRLLQCSNDLSPELPQQSSISKIYFWDVASKWWASLLAPLVLYHHAFVMTMFTMLNYQFILMVVCAFLSFIHLVMIPLVMSLQVSGGHQCTQYGFFYSFTYIFCFSLVIMPFPYTPCLVPFFGRRWSMIGEKSTRFVQSHPASPPSSHGWIFVSITKRRQGSSCFKTMRSSRTRHWSMLFDS